MKIEMSLDWLEVPEFAKTNIQKTENGESYSVSPPVIIFHRSEGYIEVAGLKIRIADRRSFLKAAEAFST